MYFVIAVAMAAPLFMLIFFRSSGVVAFVRSRRLLFRILGGLIAVGGILGMSVLTYKGVEGGPLIGVGLAVFVVGVVIAMLPGHADKVIDVDAIQAEIEARPSTPTSFDGVSEGVGAALFVVRRPLAFLRIAGPWVVIAGLPTIVAWTLVADREDIGDVKLAAALLLIAAALLTSLGAAVVAVHWHRFAVVGTLPRTGVALPDRAALGYLWRLWVIFLATGFVSGWVRNVAENLPAAPGINNDALATTLSVLVLLGMAMLAAPGGVTLAAVAGGEKEPSASVLFLRTSRWNFGFRIGVLVAALPFAIPAIVLGYAPVDLHTPAPLAIAASLGTLVLYAGALTALATYFSRAWQVAKTA